MMAMKLFAVAILVVFLGGCSTVCPAPGQPGFNNESSAPCSYSLVVKRIHLDRGEVTAMVPASIEGQKDEYRNKSYTFAVHDLKRLVDNKQVRENEEHYFFNAHNGPILKVFPLPPTN